MQRIEIKFADGEWALSLGGRPLLAVEAGTEGAAQVQFRRGPQCVAWRLRIPRGAPPPAAGALAETSWRHPAGAGVTLAGASPDGNGYATSAVLSLSSMTLPALLWHAHGTPALLSCDGSGAVAARRMPGIGRDGAPHWSAALPLAKTRGGGFASPWMRLFAAPSPRELLAAADSFGGEGHSLADAVIAIGAGSGAAAEAARAAMREDASETRWLRCEPGEYASVAKRFGSRWVVAAVNGPRPRVQTVLLDFLPEGGLFEMDGEIDDPADCPAIPMPHDPSTLPPIGTPWTNRDKASLPMAAHGGGVIWLSPVERRAAKAPRKRGPGKRGDA